MKIAFILYGKADKRSGGFLYDRYMIDYLIQKGHNVEIFSQKEGSLFRMLLENSRKKISPVISFSPDLIIEDELNHTSLFIINNYLKKKLNVKILSVVHHLRSDERLNFILKTILKFIEYYYLKSCDLFICNSRTTCRSVKKLLKNKNIKNIIVYPGKDNLPVIDRKKQGSDIVNFLFTGNLIPRKNIHKLIKIFSKKNDFNWNFKICGQICSSKYFRKLSDSASNCLKNGSIEFTGRVSDEKLAQLLSESDILIVPSEWEGFGIIYLEAMRSGVVPVASANGGACEIIDDRINGYLVSPDDDKQLEYLIDWIIENPEQIRSMEAAMRDKTMLFPGWEETMEAAADFIEKI